MGEKTLKTRFKNATNTENNWKSKNPVLLNGEIAYSSDVNKFKVGNGTSKWADLPYNKAQSTEKLATSRMVSTSSKGDFDMAFNFDGSSNAEAALKYYNCKVNVNNASNYKYHRFAKLDKITSSYTDASSIFLISQHYIDGAFGIVKVDLRTNNSSSVSSASVQWLARKGYSAESIQIGLYNVSGKTYADLFLITGGWWSNSTIRNLASGNRGGIQRTWKLMDSTEANDTTTTDKKTSVESYSSIENAATELHGQAYTNIIVGVDVGTVANANKVNNHTVDKNVPSTAKFTDTTYTSKTAVSGGTDVSLVTTGEKAIWNAKTSNTGTITGIKMNGVSKGSSGVVDLGTVLTSGKQTTTSTADGGSNVYTFSDNSTITIKNGSKGSTGTNGTSAAWFTGTAVTGTSTSATSFSVSGSKAGDMYLNTSTYNVYRASASNSWIYVCNIKGATGSAGTNGTNGTNGTRGSVINYGTAITGTSTTATAFSSSGLTSSLVGDMYMNTSTSYLYRCTVAGNASTAKWVYVGSMKGATGAKGDKGDPGVNATTTSVATTSANGLMSSSDKSKLNGIASGATAVTDSTVSGWGYKKTDTTYDMSIAYHGNPYSLMLSENGTTKTTINFLPGTNVTMSLSGTNLTINAKDTTYSTGTASTSGLTKLYTSTGTNTDGTLTQSAINNNYVPISNGKLNISNSGNAAGIVCFGREAHGFAVKNDGSVDITGLSTMDGKTYDTGWKSVSSGAKIVNWSTNDAPKIRRVGKVVELTGIVKSSEALSNYTSFLTNIPSDMRPSSNRWFIQQGGLNTTNRWMLTINTSGTASFDYYGTTSATSVSAGAALIIHATWMVD